MPMASGPKFQGNGTPTATSSLKANGQGVNTASLLAGLRHDSGVKANTGTATGDRAAADFAKSQLAANEASVNRGSAQQNSEFQAKQQQAKEQLTQQARNNQLKRFQQSSSQFTDQANLANELKSFYTNQQNNWQTSLIGMLRN